MIYRKIVVWPRYICGQVSRLAKGKRGFGGISFSKSGDRVTLPERRARSRTFRAVRRRRTPGRADRRKSRESSATPASPPPSRAPSISTHFRYEGIPLPAEP